MKPSRDIVMSNVSLVMSAPRWSWAPPRNCAILGGAILLIADAESGAVHEQVGADLAVSTSNWRSDPPNIAGNDVEKTAAASTATTAAPLGASEHRSHP
jgi:hypothetical protein